MTLPDNPTREEVQEALDWLDNMPRTLAFIRDVQAFEYYLSVAHSYAELADETADPAARTAHLRAAHRYALRSIMGDVTGLETSA